MLNEAKTLTKTYNTARNSEMAENLILDEWRLRSYKTWRMVKAKMTRLNEPISQTALDFLNDARKEMPLILDTVTYWSEKLNTSKENVKL